jgi:hypothetical protein
MKKDASWCDTSFVKKTEKPKARMVFGLKQCASMWLRKRLNLPLKAVA